MILQHSADAQLLSEEILRAAGGPGPESADAEHRVRVLISRVRDLLGDPAAIEADAAALCRNWATPRGGLVFSDYGDGQAIGVPGDDVDIGDAEAVVVALKSRTGSKGSDL